MRTALFPRSRPWLPAVAAAALATFLTVSGCDSTTSPLQPAGMAGAGGGPAGAGGAPAGAGGAPSGAGGAAGAPATGGPVTDPGTGGVRAGLQANGSISYVRTK
jgi:hypothetical protein